MNYCALQNRVLGKVLGPIRAAYTMGKLDNCPVPPDFMGSYLANISN